MPIITAVSSPTTALITSTSDASGNISFVTAGSTAMTLDTNQNAVHTGYVSMPNTFGFKNRIINGAMVIDQRNAGGSFVATTGQYLVDRFVHYTTQNSKFTIGQNLNSVTPPPGFTKYLGIQTTTAYSSLSSGDYFCLAQRIEGYNVADLGWGTANAKPVTLSFWVYSSLTGTFGGVLQNGSANRSYLFSYTISVANTWTQISISAPGDTTGTWGTVNGDGIIVLFGLGQGSNFNGSAGSWTGNNYQNVTGAVSVVGTLNATFYITGVQLEAGSKATPFDYRDYGRELIMCQRYYQNYATYGVTAPDNSPIAIATFVSSTDIRTNFPFPVAMRARPTVVASSASSNFRYYNGTNYYSNTLAFDFGGFNGIGLTANGTGSGFPSAGLTAIVFAQQSGASLAFNSEL